MASLESSPKFSVDLMALKKRKGTRPAVKRTGRKKNGIATDSVQYMHKTAQTLGACGSSAPAIRCLSWTSDKAASQSIWRLLLVTRVEAPIAQMLEIPSMTANSLLLEPTARCRWFQAWPTRCRHITLRGEK